MALTEYEVQINGVTTRLQLSEEDARAYPEAKKVGSVDTTESKRAKAPANKATSAENK